MTASTPLEWIRTCNTGELTGYADTWDQLGKNLEQVYQKYVDAVTKVDGAYWEGKAAQAAHDRATGDLKTVQILVDKLTALATQARQGRDAIDVQVQKARGLLAECDHNKWAVSPVAMSVGPGPGHSSEVSTEELAHMATMSTDLQAAIQAALGADVAVRDALNNARGELALAFASNAALGDEQGKNDGKHLATDPSHMSDAEIRRLIEAGQLTPEQLAALHDGNAVTIPASQMQYLNEISRSLDGKSPQEIQQIMDKLPPDAQKGLANSLQLVSTNTVTTGISGDPTVPEHGDGKLLPKKMQDSLGRKDLVQDKWDTTGSWSNRSINLNGVADNQAIAKIAGTADPGYRSGSELDKKVLDVGAKYLDAQTQWEQDKNNKFVGFTVDGRGTDPHGALTENMFRAVGDDKAAVANLVVGSDGKPNEQFFHDALTHQWTDDGKAVSTMFTFPDHPNPVDAHRQASIMSAFGQFAASDNTPSHVAGGDDKWKLFNIPGTDHKSVGQLNPDLVRSLSHSMSPYMNDLTNPNSPSADGFKVTDSSGHSWTDPDNNGTFRGSKNIFSLMDTDDEAGKHFNATALETSLQHQVAYGQDPNAHDAYAHLRASGQLQGLVDGGLRDEISSKVQSDSQAAQEVYNHKKLAYDTIKSVIGTSVPIGTGDDAITAKIPGTDGVSKILGLGGDPLRDAIIGPAPTAGNNDIGLNPPSFDHQAYNVVASTDVPPALRAKYGALFDSAGNLKSWPDIQQSQFSAGGTSQMSDVTSLFNELGQRDGHDTAMRDGYGDVTGDHRANDQQKPHNGR